MTACSSQWRITARASPWKNNCNSLRQVEPESASAACGSVCGNSVAPWRFVRTAPAPRCSPPCPYRKRPPTNWPGTKWLPDVLVGEVLPSFVLLSVATLRHRRLRWCFDHHCYLGARLKADLVAILVGEGIFDPDFSI